MFFVSYDPPILIPESIEQGRVDAAYCLFRAIIRKKAIKKIKKINFWYLSKRARKKVDKLTSSYISYKEADAALIRGVLKINEFQRLYASLNQEDKK